MNRKPSPLLKTSQESRNEHIEAQNVSKPGGVNKKNQRTTLLKPPQGAALLCDIKNDLKSCNESEGFLGLRGSDSLQTIHCNALISLL